MKEKQKHRYGSGRLMSIAVAGLMESLMSDLADNPPKNSTKEEIARNREAAQEARKDRDKLMGLSEKGGAR